MKNLPEVDFYAVLDPILIRPAMYLGKKSLTLFRAYLDGITHLGAGEMVGVKPVYRMVSNPPFHDFPDWVRKKYNHVNEFGYALSIWSIFLELAGNKEDTEARALDLFISDLKEYRCQQIKVADVKD